MRFVAWAMGALAAMFGISASPPPSPDAVVIFTGDIRGYLSPCGCSDPMIGGVERMAGVVRQLSRQPNSYYVDLGNWLDGADRQEQLKAEALAQTWKSLKPTYLNVSRADRQLGDGYLAAMRSIVGGAIDSAELEMPALPGEPAVRVGPLSITGVTSSRAAALQGNPGGSRVVLVAGSLDEAKSAAEIAGSGLYIYSLQGDPPKEPVHENGSTFVTAGDHCRFVGRIELQNGRWSSFQLIELGPELPNDGQAAQAYRAYLKRVTEENLLADVPKRKGTPNYVGSEACLSCHEKEFDGWKKSLHAVAYDTLRKTGNHRDPECVGCHVVGLDHESGFTSVERRPQMAAVGCESCHGQASKHLESPYATYGAAGEVSCLPCHTTSNSPNFEFSTYWKKIEHGQGLSRARELAEKVRAADGKTQYALLSELGSLGEDAIGELRLMLLGDDRSLSFWALLELVGIRSRHVLPVLIERQKAADEKDLSSSILLAFGNHGNPRAYNVVKPYLRSKTPNVRWAAAAAMGGLGDPAAIPLLEKLLKDENASVRWQARQSIKNIRSIVGKYPDRLTKKQWWSD
jgi:hypothetical protein